MAQSQVPPSPLPTKKYKITVRNTGQEFEVDPQKIPYGRNGLPGSILDILLSQDDDLIDHACGGVQACATCHILVEKGLESCSEISDREDDYLDQTPGLALNSRLSCACIPDGTEDITISIPDWNRNEVRE
jgi:2Fe-2S ferredoxin